MASDTKERILTAALEMFSQNGYAGTNLRELAGSLGMGKSSMYRHFESKEALWNTLLDRMIAYYGARFGSSEHLPPVPDSLDGLVSMTMRMVDFTVHDEKIVMTRKVLAIEQFRDERAKQLATKHFITGLTQMFTHVFRGMMDKGLLRQDEPEMLAFAYTTPISALIHLCDREPEKAGEATSQIEAFSRHFVQTYGKILTVNEAAYSVLRLLGKGKGGYSYLAERDGQQVVVKQIHHEPCDYYCFGNKLEAELRDYARLQQAGIRIPAMLATDEAAERIVKEYIEGDTICDFLRSGRSVAPYLPQVREMAAQAKACGLNIDYFPTNFVVQGGRIWYVDYECNDYMDEWSFENWGVKYWSRTPELEEYLKRG